MTFLEILRYDSKNNQDDVSLEDMLESYENLKQKGFYELKTDKTIFMIKPKDSTVFYHTANAAPRQEYLQGLKEFYSALSSKGYKVAYTTLENPKLKTLINKYLKDSTFIIKEYAVTLLQ